MDVLVALLGIMKAGAAYVPLDPEHPADRVAFVLADCRARAVVTTSAFAAREGGRSAGIIVVALDECAAELAAQPAARLLASEVGLSPRDLCYVIYTSGTTGRPKGVEIEHRSACHLVRAEGRIFQVRPEDRVFQGFSIAFDASVEEIWLAFFAGATLVVGTPEMMRAGAGLGPLLAAAGVTVLSCVPTLLAMMEEDAPSVRLLILGGEVCPPDLVSAGGSRDAAWSTLTARRKPRSSPRFAECRSRQARHHWPSAAQLFRAHSGRESAARGGRGGGRIVPGRRRAGARLPGAAGIDGGKIY
jgi:non-ribosomal peptide synthetase component F